MKPKLEDLRAFNRIGWWALQHREELWWVGTKEGVVCWRDKELAKAANTYAYGREAGKLVFQVREFTGADKDGGEHIPALSFKDGMKWLKERGRI